MSVRSLEPNFDHCLKRENNGSLNLEHRNRANESMCSKSKCDLKLFFDESERRFTRDKKSIF